MAASAVVSKPPLPLFDGDSRVYVDSSVRCCTTAASQGFWFVNGMNTSPQAHADAALQISRITGAPVLGFYNQNGLASFQAMCTPSRTMALLESVNPAFAAIKTAACNTVIQDIGQCVWDWLLRVIAEAESDSSSPLALVAYLPRAYRERLAKMIFDYNPCTTALMNAIVAARSSSQVISLVCHSQGNLIAANALGAAKFILGLGTISWIRVLALASPVPVWPEGVKVQAFTYKNDLVTWLSLGRSYTGNSVVGTSKAPGVLGPHGVDGYFNLSGGSMAGTP